MARTAKIESVVLVIFIIVPFGRHAMLAGWIIRKGLIACATAASIASRSGPCAHEASARRRCTPSGFPCVAGLY